MDIVATEMARASPVPSPTETSRPPSFVQSSIPETDAPRADTGLIICYTSDRTCLVNYRSPIDRTRLAFGATSQFGSKQNLI